MQPLLPWSVQPTRWSSGAGTHYFASGVYYFTNTVTLQPGAVVVAGEGRYQGCAVDAEAVFANNGPQGAQREVAREPRSSSVEPASSRPTTHRCGINRRVSDTTTRGTETVAIRSVHFCCHAGRSSRSRRSCPDDVMVIADVYNAANTACDASLSTTGLPPEGDQPHGAGDTDSAGEGVHVVDARASTMRIIEFNQTGGNATSNQFVADGCVFVPNAKVILNGGANTGLPAASLRRARSERTQDDLQLDAVERCQLVPWRAGRERSRSEVGLTTTVTAPNGQRTISRATLEVNVDGSYAINGWTVDPNAGVAPPTVATTAPPPTTTTTTLPPTTTSTTTTSTTTHDHHHDHDDHAGADDDGESLCRSGDVVEG